MPDKPLGAMRTSFRALRKASLAFLKHTLAPSASAVRNPYSKSLLRGVLSPSRVGLDVALNAFKPATLSRGSVVQMD